MSKTVDYNDMQTCKFCGNETGSPWAHVDLCPGCATREEQFHALRDNNRELAAALKRLKGITLNNYKNTCYEWDAEEEKMWNTFSFVVQADAALETHRALEQPQAPRNPPGTGARLDDRG